MEQLFIQTILATERPRLIRLCARLSGSWDAAEDLAQETLLQAWHHAERLPDWNQATPWLSAIARNVCLHWSRRHYREQSQLDQSAQTDSPSANYTIAQLHDDFDLEFELERKELVTLLDQALALLPPETRLILIQKYVEESPYSEIAAQLGVSENAVAVRAHRGKLAFQRILTHELRVEALAYGLLTNERNGSNLWEETRIWCPHCGAHRLLGQFQKGASTGVFELRCPTCHDGAVATHADLSIPFFSKTLGDVKMYKPAFTRLLTTMGKYYRQALTKNDVPCLACNHQTFLWVGARSSVTPDARAGYEVCIRCKSCELEINSSLDSLAMILPEAQRFWRAHPRLRTLPTREIEFKGTPALVTRFRSVTDPAGLDVIAARDSFEIMGVYPVRDN